MLNLKFTEVKRFNRAAVAHRDAAKALLDKCPLKGSSTLGHEVVYLSGYVVECALKALLLAQYPQREHAELVAWFKSDLKHNLEWLKGKLAEKGVNFPREQKENLRRLRRQDEGWSPEMRYAILAWRRDEAERVFLAAEAILIWVNGG